MGDVEKRIAQECYRSGEPLPDRIKNAPDLICGLELFFAAYQELETERQIGFGLGPIPFTAILKYVEFYQLEKEQADDLIYFVRKLDTHFMIEQAKKAKK